MIRVFLALLALFAGLVAQLSPAQARDAGVSEVAASVADASAQGACVAVTQDGPSPARATWQAAPDRSPSPQRQAPMVATVRHGVDRARE